MAYGARRARRRVDAGTFAPHPGWQRRRVRFAARCDGSGRPIRGAVAVVEALDGGRVTLVDQAAALARMVDLVDAELWRDDRRAVTLAVLRGLAHAMSWETGLIAGVTRAHLAALAECSLRTVSRVLRWASSVALLECVETGASAAALGTKTNRAPSYRMTAPRVSVREEEDAVAGDELGNPPVSYVGREDPRRDRGFQDRQDEGRNRPAPVPWPIFDAPTTAAERSRAAQVFLERAGIAGRVIRWRATAMLAAWFVAGWSPMALLHAVDHHPDFPEGESRGDAVRSAHDPLRVIGFRLSPWQGRMDALPASLRPGARSQAAAPVEGRAELAARRTAGITAGLGARAEIRAILATRPETR